MRKMKSDPKMAEIGTRVAKVRKTAKDDLLLELDKEAERKASSLRAAVDKVLVIR